MIVKKELILASSSLRRQQLLRQIGLSYRIVTSGIEEHFDPAATVEDNVQRIAYEKAQFVGESVTEGFIIGADTVVVLDGLVLGKPKNEEDAIRMLNILSGKTHKVFTGICILEKPGNESVCSVEITDVTFRSLEQQEIIEYVQGGSPMDKAGSYGIQDDYGAVFVERIAGCYYNVVGFPLARFYLLMQDFQKKLGLL